MKVKVCKKCSGIDVDKLESFLADKDVKLKVKCVGDCKLRKLNKYFGTVAGNMLIFDTEDEFFQNIEEGLQKKESKKKHKKEKKDKK